jgi:hypothetical protein
MDITPKNRSMSFWIGGILFTQAARRRASRAGQAFIETAIVFRLTRFLHANRSPLRLKTL